MAARRRKALERLCEATGPVPLALVEAALRACDYENKTSRRKPTHRVWERTGSLRIAFAVRHGKGRESVVLYRYIRRIQQCLC